MCFQVTAKCHVGDLGCRITPDPSLVESIISADLTCVLTDLLPRFSQTQALENYENYPAGPPGEKCIPLATSEYTPTPNYTLWFRHLYVVASKRGLWETGEN